MLEFFICITEPKTEFAFDSSFVLETPGVAACVPIHWSQDMCDILSNTFVQVKAFIVVRP